jgi:pimeloyl-ACP methyl ester carboxylesterase
MRRFFGRVSSEMGVSVMSSVPLRVFVMLAIAALPVFAVAAEQAESSVESSVQTTQRTKTAAKKTGYAPVNGLKMYYEVTGAGRPAVFIHPIVSHCGLIPRLTGNRQWISMDLQGHGRTADIDRPLTCEQHADDIAALLKHLKVEEADVFGDSFGGAIAVTLAVRHPRLVGRVVIYGSPLAPFPKEIADIFTPDSELIKWEREEYQKVAPDPGHWPTLFAKVLKCGSDWKGFSLDELRAIKTPILIACGDQDLIPVERCVELSRLIPKAQLAVIPDASHFVLFSQPDKLLPTIAAFLDAPTSKVPLSTFKTGYYPGLTR